MAEEKKRGGGPKTPEGKARSSRNSFKHGACAEALILPTESQEDFDRVVEEWRREFEPEGYQEERLVEILIQNDWFLRRADKAWHAGQVEGNDQHTLELMQRYRTTAERSFYRAWGAVRSLRKDLMREDDGNRKRAIREIRLEADLKAKDALISQLQEQAKARAAASAKKDAKSKKKEKLVVLEQWADICTNDGGKTVTKLVPSNEELQKEAAKMGREPDLVCRRLFFAGAVPAEYRWSTKDPQALAFGGLGMQRMTWAAWKQQIAQEMILTGGHLQPCANMPRPHERGGCECPVCMENQWMLAEAGLE